MSRPQDRFKDRIWIQHPEITWDDIKLACDPIGTLGYEGCPACKGESTRETELWRADDYCGEHMQPWPVETSLRLDSAGLYIMRALLAGKAVKLKMEYCRDGTPRPLIALAEPSDS